MRLERGVKRIGSRFDFLDERVGGPCGGSVPPKQNGQQTTNESFSSSNEYVHSRKLKGFVGTKTSPGPGLVPRAIRREAGRMHPWRPNEVEEVFCRSGGPGGQHVNKVSTAVTLRHIATGISVRVSSSRSQARNRAEAIRLLADKLEAAAAAARQLRLAETSKNRRRRAKRSRSTKRRLVESKRRRSETKQLRKRVS